MSILTRSIFSEFMFFRRKKTSPPPKDETVFAESLRSLQELISEADADSTTTRDNESPEISQSVARDTAPRAPAQVRPIKRAKPELRRTEPTTPSNPEPAVPQAESPPAAPRPTAQDAPSLPAHADDDFPVLTEVVFRAPAEPSPDPTPLTPAALAAHMVDLLVAEIGAPEARKPTPEIMARLTEQVRTLLEDWTCQTRSASQAGATHKERA